MYKITFEGLSREFPDLLAAMEHRNHILSLCPPAAGLLAVWRRDGNGWEYFDTESFLRDLAVLLAPAE